MSNANNRPPDIITRFARQLSHMLAEHLTSPEWVNKRHPLKDCLAVAIMVILTDVKLYREGLLFRDYSTQGDELYITLKEERIHTESIFYVGEVLSKRLVIVSKHKSFPSNLHFLFLMLCRYSQEPQFLRTWVKRRKLPAVDIHDTFFSATANALKKQCQRLKTMSSVSMTYREKYGVLYLLVGHNRAEMPEEISLMDLVEAVPMPLNDEIKQSPVWYAPLLERIVLSLNERYGLLRSCGLPPQEFWDNEKLSIGKLRELKNLKKITDSYLMTGEKQKPYDAYERAFADLLNSKKEAKAKNPDKPDKKLKVAGFTDFLDFVGSEEGAWMVKTKFESFYGDDDNQKHELAAPPVFNNDDMRETSSLFLFEHASYFTPVTTYYFEQAVIEQRSAEGKVGFFNDVEFCRLVAADKQYAHLDTDKLRTKLCKHIEDLLEKLKFSDWMKD